MRWYSESIARRTAFPADCALVARGGMSPRYRSSRSASRRTRSWAKASVGSGTEQLGESQRRGEPLVHPCQRRAPVGGNDCPAVGDQVKDPI
jgi:hypothetical protein